MKKWIRNWFVFGVVVGAVAMANIYFNPYVQDVFRIKVILAAGNAFWAGFGLIAWADGAVDWKAIEKLVPEPLPFEQQSTIDYANRSLANRRFK